MPIPNLRQYSSRLFPSETVEKYKIYPLKSEGFLVLFSYRENHQEYLFLLMPEVPFSPYYN
jgi:hypothetical protein